MTDTARITAIRIYPVKSLDPHPLEAVRIGASGSLLGDRRFALFNEQHQLVNGKSEPLLHRIRCRYDDEIQNISVNGGRWMHLFNERDELEHQLSSILGYKVFLKEDVEGGLLDDPAGSHLTVVSKASLEAVAEWFGFDDLEEVRMRFRANIELEEVPPFWEDHLFLPGKQPVPCTLGNVEANGRKPCPRCPVPARHPLTGVVDKGFQKQFTAQRLQQLPEWSHLKSYPHAYCLATTLVVANDQQGKEIRCGDFLRKK
ncbi:MAG: MOSC domain-containing protein [Bacteroidota bacterium]